MQPAIAMLQMNLFQSETQRERSRWAVIKQSSRVAIGQGPRWQWQSAVVATVAVCIPRVARICAYLQPCASNIIITGNCQVDQRNNRNDSTTCGNPVALPASPVLYVPVYHICAAIRLSNASCIMSVEGGCVRH